MTPESIKELLETYDITPNRVLGQNFLIDKTPIDLLIEAANINEDDVIIEVGPGTGMITKELAKRAGKVLAVEKDQNMIIILKNELAKYKNVEIINEDILRFQITNHKSQITNKSNPPAGRTNFKKPNIHNIEAKRYKLIGAPPYYLTARLFRHFLEGAQATGVRPLLPESISLIIQKEVAQKICAKPPHMNLLAISVQLYGKPKIIKKISKNAFWPRPKVDSAILTVENIKKPDINEKEFFKIVKAGFSSPRKQLSNNLSQNLSMSREEIANILKTHKINPKRRAETLTTEDWKKLTKAL